MPYTREDYILFFLAIILGLIALALLGFWAERRNRRKANKLARQLQRLNRHDDLRRRHRAWLAQMDRVLESVEGRKSA